MKTYLEPWKDHKPDCPAEYEWGECDCKDPRGVNRPEKPKAFLDRVGALLFTHPDDAQYHSTHLADWLENYRVWREFASFSEWAKVKAPSFDVDSLAILPATPRSWPDQAAALAFEAFRAGVNYGVHARAPALAAQATAPTQDGDGFA